MFVCDVPSDDDDDGDNNSVKIMRPLNSRGRTAQSNNDQKVKSTKRTPSDGDDISVRHLTHRAVRYEFTLIGNRLKEAERRAQSATKRTGYLPKNDLVEEQFAAKLLCEARAIERDLEVTKEENSQLKATMLQNDHEITALKEEVATIKAKCKTLASDRAHGILVLLRNHEKMISQLKDTMLTALKEEVATVKGNYETLRNHDEEIFQLKDTMLTALKEEVATVKGKYETLASDHANVKRDHEHDLAILKSRINQKAKELNDSIARITQFKVQFSTLTEEKDQLAMKLDDEDQGKECVVCKESRKEYVFFPCGHMCVCEGCAASIQGRDRKCPLCRGVSTSIMKIFH